MPKRGPPDPPREEIRPWSSRSISSTSVQTATPAKDGSPSFYATDDGRYVVQGYKLTDEATRSQLVHFPPDREDAVIVTQELVDIIARQHGGRR